VLANALTASPSCVSIEEVDMKSFTGGTIIAAVALAASPDAARAQTPRAFALELGGYMEQSFGGASNRRGVRAWQARSSTSTAVIVAKPTRFAQQYDSEIWFSGRTKLDNGVVIGVKVELEANTQFDQIDESYLYVDSVFGRLVLGAKNDAAYTMHVGAPRAGEAWGVLESPVTSWVYTPRFVTFLSTSAPTTTGDDQKVTYFTPRYRGLQAGISFTPNEREDRRELTDRAKERANIWSMALNFSERIGAIDLRSSFGWVQAPGARTATDPGDRHALSDAAAGASIGYAGVSVGGGYRWIRNPNGAVDGYALTAGLAYEQGPVGASLATLHSRAAGAIVPRAADLGRIYVASVAYRVAPGVSGIASAFHASYRGEDSRLAVTDNNRGSGMTAGIKLRF
jgi:predicted porin